MEKRLAALLSSKVGLALLATFCTLAASPFLILYCLYEAVWRSLVRLACPKVQPVGIGDEIWFHVMKEDGTVNCLMEFEGVMDLQTARDLLHDRIIAGPSTISHKFCHRVETRLGRSVWLRHDEFDITEHIEAYARRRTNKDNSEGPVVEQDIVSEAELPTVVSELCSKRRFDFAKPLWHLEVIRTASGKTVWLLQLHHIMSDGVAFMDMMRNHFFDKSQDGEEAAAPSQTNASRHSSFSNAYKSLPSGPRTLVKLFSLGKKTDLFSSKNHEGRIAAWSRGLDFHVMRSLRFWTDSTVNDVFLSAVAGAFLRYSREENYDDAMQNLPAEVRVYVPVNMRASPLRPLEPLNNQLSMVYFTMPLLIEDARERLELIKHRLVAVKNSIQPMLTYLLMNYVMPRMPLRLATMLYRWGSRGDAILVSNLPGPPTRVSVGSYEVEKMMFWPPSAEFTGIRVSMLTYNTQAFFGAMCDNRIVHNPKKFINCIEKVLRALEQEVVPL